MRYAPSCHCNSMYIANLKAVECFGTVLLRGTNGWSLGSVSVSVSMHACMYIYVCLYYARTYISILS